MKRQNHRSRWAGFVLAAVLGAGGLAGVYLHETAPAAVDAAQTAAAVPVAEPDPAPATERTTVERPDGPAAERADGPDREIFRSRLAYAGEQGLASRPVGEIVERLGRTFLGTPYTAHTLEIPGPERLVVNLRELDCVTFVENTLVLARMARAGADDFDAFRAELQQLRYRDGVIDGYASRLHYFSEWIADAERKGLVRDVTRELGGVRAEEPIDFMSTHPDAYEKLADEERLDAIRRVEAELNEGERYYVPQERIAEVAPRIRSGDVIAATSSVEGLDVAHTGLAIRVDGRLHLLHAPLVGEAVQISDVPLAERIQRIDGQDGIMVARPI